MIIFETLEMIASLIFPNALAEDEENKNKTVPQESREVTLAKGEGRRGCGMDHG